jgi:hypothetical protein
MLLNFFSGGKALGLYCKTLWICNLQTMDTLCGKLVYLLLSATLNGLDKHTSLLT